MRLKIMLHKDTCTLPLNYQHLLQGLIYESLPKDEEGRFYHDEGYRVNEKKYKMFVFSNLFGKNTVNLEKRTITFKDYFYLYFAAEDEKLIQSIYRYFKINKFICLGKELIEITNMDIISNPYFNGKKKILIRTISPAVGYRTVNGYVTYFSPSSEEFETLVQENLIHKKEALNLDETICFKIIEVIDERKRIVHFKNTFYVAYNTTLLIETNSDTLSLLLNTGLCGKGSAGFGMIEIQN